MMGVTNCGTGTNLCRFAMLWRQEDGLALLSAISSESGRMFDSGYGSGPTFARTHNEV